MNRRNFLRITGIGVAALALPKLADAALPISSSTGVFHKDVMVKALTGQLQKPARYVTLHTAFPTSEKQDDHEVPYMERQEMIMPMIGEGALTFRAEFESAISCIITHFSCGTDKEGPGNILYTGTIRWGSSDYTGMNVIPGMTLHLSGSIEFG